MGTSHAGKLLVASPAITDPNFYRTVVLLCAHDEDGAFGLVLNRPAAEAPVDAYLEGWAAFASEPAVLFRGGPVERSAAFALARCGPIAPPGWRGVLGRTGLMDLSDDPPEGESAFEAFRVFTGYAGWSPGQLEEEIEGGGWFVVDATTDDVFAERPADLWRTVLGRQAGELRFFARFPEDPRLN